MNKRCVLAVALALLLCLAACSGGGPDTPGTSGEVASPADLMGTWIQTDADAGGVYHMAFIAEEEISVFWVGDAGGGKQLYWSGSFVPPAEPVARYEWISANEAVRSPDALLASGEAEKTFTYENGVLRYEVSALGTTTAVALERADPDEPTPDDGAQGEPTDVSGVPDEPEKPGPTSAGSGLQPVAIEGQVLLDRDGVVITAKSFDTETHYGPTLKVLIENNSDRRITFQAGGASVNGCMVGTWVSCDVGAGKKANTGIEFSKADLELAGISLCKDIEFTIYGYEETSWEPTLNSGPIRLSTDADASFVQAFDRTGDVVLERDGIKVTAKRQVADEGDQGSAVHLFIENTSARDVYLRFADASVNGFMLNPSFSGEIAAGKVRFTSMFFYKEDLEENDIAEISEIEGIFYATEAYTFERLFESDPVVMTFD